MRHIFWSWWRFSKDLCRRQYALVARIISPAYLHTNLQLANLFTKALAAAQFSFLLSKISAHGLHSPARRGVNADEQVYN